jgi:DNA invertase Pin-like site-specific DNA recombinase
MSGITDKKTPWDVLSDSDKKSFTPYIINRWLSMNMDFIELVNELQRYTIGQISPEETYKLYYDILPKQKQFNKYIKGKKADKYNPALVELLSMHFLVSEKEAMEYIDMYQETSLNTLKEIIKKYGKTDKEVDKLLKNEKN